MIKMTKYLIVFVLISCATNVNATMPVFDYVGLAQQLVHYITMCDQYATQTQQYTRQIQQLQNEYEHLRNLNYKVDLSGLNDMKQVMNFASGLSNDFARIQTQFEQPFPVSWRQSRVNRSSLPGRQLSNKK
jgi:P-type conjugative transfer protein TrbJ